MLILSKSKKLFRADKLPNKIERRNNMTFAKVSETVYNRVIPELESNPLFNGVMNYDDIKLPTRGTPGSAGYDFYSPISFTLHRNESIVVPSFIRFVINPGEDKYFLMMVPKSGLGFRYNMTFANTVGIIDSDYFLTSTDDSTDEGNILIDIINGNRDEMIVDKGQKICQGIILPFTTVANDEVIQKVRNGGIGSTGLK